MNPTTPRSRPSRRLALGATAMILVGLIGAAPVSARDPERPERPATPTRQSGERLERRDGASISGDTTAETIDILSATAYVNPDDTLFVVGEIRSNMTTRRANLVSVQVDLYDGAELVSTIPGYSFLWQLGYGATSPFYAFGDAPAGVTDFEASVVDTGDPTAMPPGGALLIQPGAVTIEGDQRHFTGTVKNVGNVAVEFLTVAVTTFDGSGDVVDGTYSGAVPDSVAPGATTTYDLFLPYDPMAPFARAAFTADGFEASGDAYHTSWDNYFDDVGLSSFRPDIIWNAEQGITTGCGAGKFCPTANVPRDQMASFLSRALGLSGPAVNAFTDDTGNPHEPNINLVAREGIASGCGGTNYCPSALVARDQMASFLSRALDLSGPAPNAFTDDNGNIHEPNINLVAREGIASGCGGSNYCPTAKVTRGQMAAFLHRAFD